MFTLGSCAAAAQCGRVGEVAADKRQVQKLPRDKNSLLFGRLGIGINHTSYLRLSTPKYFEAWKLYTQKCINSRQTERKAVLFAFIIAAVMKSPWKEKICKNIRDKLVFLITLTARGCPLNKTQNKLTSLFIGWKSHVMFILLESWKTLQIDILVFVLCICGLVLFLYYIDYKYLLALSQRRVAESNIHYQQTCIFFQT